MQAERLIDTANDDGGRSGRPMLRQRQQQGIATRVRAARARMRFGWIAAVSDPWSFVATGGRPYPEDILALMHDTSLENSVLVRLLESLLDQGADPNVRDAKGLSPLRHACGRDSAPCVRLLLQRGAEPNIVYPDGWSALQVAIIDSCPEVVYALLKGGASPFVAGSYGWNSLHTAVAAGRYGIVKLLLNESRTPYREAIDTPTVEGLTAVHVACYEGHVTSLRILLSYGANLNVRDKRNRSPLFYAALRAHVPCVRMLFEYGAFKVCLPDKLSNAVAEELARWPTVPTLARLTLNTVRDTVRTEPHLLQWVPPPLRRLF